MYVIYDTQLIIEAAERNDKDIPRDTLMLFIDFLDLFIKLLQILIELQDRKKNKDRDD